MDFGGLIANAIFAQVNLSTNCNARGLKFKLRLAPMSPKKLRNIV